jgi:hypothetical protein
MKYPEPDEQKHGRAGKTRKRKYIFFSSLKFLIAKGR